MARARPGGDGRGEARGEGPCRGVIVTAITGLKKCTHSLHFTPPTGGRTGARVHGAHARRRQLPLPRLPPLPPPSSARSSLTYIATMDGKEGAGAGPN